MFYNQNKIKKTLLIRPATPDDILIIYHLANDPTVRANGFNPKKISIKEHRVWFKKKLKDKNALILIAEKEELFVGQIRFDFGKENIIGISISSNFRRQGFSSLLIREGLKYVQKIRPEIKKITAYIKVDNIASIKTFEKSGFRLDQPWVVDGYKALKYIYSLR